MIIEIEIDDIETFEKAINNAFVAYADICSSISVGCEPQVLSGSFAPLATLPEGELEKRFLTLKDVYEQVEAKEKMIKEVWKND